MEYNLVHSLKYSFDMLVVYLSISILCMHFFILLLYYIWEGNIALFTPLQLFAITVTSYFLHKNIYAYISKLQILDVSQNLHEYIWYFKMLLQITTNIAV